MSPTPAFSRAIALIDAANAADPHTTLINGQSVPNELLYARRMTAWLEKLAPGAPEHLRLAARAQHIRRWEIPRSSYPADRAGYLRWRSTLYRHHADITSAILKEAGFDQPAIDRVASLLLKQNIKAEPDMQLLEDIICLVFLENYFADFARTREEAKLLGIVQKTWKKMSPRGRHAALSLDLPPAIRELIGRALA